MKKLIVFILAGLLVTGAVSFVNASGKDDAKVLVEKAVAFVKANGKEKALAEFNNPKGKFVKGEFYVFVYDMNATILAHPVNPKLVGKNFLNVCDPDRKYFRKDIVEVARTTGVGWVDYKYKNPKTEKIVQKTTYLKRVGDMIVCCGAYK